MEVVQTSKSITDSMKSEILGFVTDARNSQPNDLWEQTCLIKPKLDQKYAGNWIVIAYEGLVAANYSIFKDSFIRLSFKKNPIVYYDIAMVGEINN